MYKFITALLLTLITLSAHAYRCGQSLVSKGSTMYEVLRVCGEPLNQNSYQKSVCSWNEYIGQQYCAEITVDVLTYKRSGVTNQMIFHNKSLYKIDSCRVC